MTALVVSLLVNHPGWGVPRLTSAMACGEPRDGSYGVASSERKRVSHRHNGALTLNLGYRLIESIIYYSLWASLRGNMGLFHKTLRDAKALAQAGRWGEVIKIIEKHRTDELIIHKDFTSLAGAIDGYVMAIRNLQTLLRQQPRNTTEILAGLDELEFIILRQIEDCMTRLIRDRKLAFE